MKANAFLFFAAASIIASTALAQLSIKWEDNLDSAQKRAKVEKKLIFVDVWAEWCGPCIHMKENIFTSPIAKQALGEYIPAALMTQNKKGVSQKANMVVAEKYKVEGLPTLLVLDGDGKEIKRYVGAFRTVEEFTAWLKGK